MDEEQIIRAYSFSLNEAAQAEKALAAASAPHEGRVPDALYLCAGSARPGFFVEETPAGLQSAFDNVYWVQAWSAYVRTFSAVLPELMRARRRAPAHMRSSADREK